MDVFEEINMRHSVRTFSGVLPPQDVLKSLKARLSELKTDSYRISLIDSTLAGNIASYGVISGAPAWLALVSNDTPEATLRCAMSAEELVLWLTGQGIGTCWVGGTFKTGSVAKAVQISDGEKIVAVIPFGVAAAKRRLIERIQSKFANARARKPFDTLFRVSDKAPDTFHKILEAVRLAPSALNAQPWRIEVDDAGKAVFRAATDNAYTMLDMGIALTHFKLAASALGVEGAIVIDNPRPELIAVWQ